MESGLRVTRIHVVRLFNEINYDIHLDEDKPVGIIIAPNGRGKTTILKLLAFVLRPTYERYLEIKYIPFARFVCHLSNGKRILLEANQSKEVIPIEPRFEKHKGKEHLVTEIERPVNNLHYRILSAEKSENEGIKIFDTINMLKGSIWKGLPNGYLLDSEDIEDSGTRLNSHYQRQIDEMESEVERTVIESTLMAYILQNMCSKPVTVIDTSRLHEDKKARNYNIHSASENIDGIDPLEEASKHIAGLILDARDVYNKKVAEAKDRLPRMFLKEDIELLEEKTFLNKWKNYTDELKKLQEIGLIEKSKDFISTDEIPSVYKDKTEFLNKYLEAFRYTTRGLTNLYNKLALLKRIFDERNIITHKTIGFGPEGIKIFVRKQELEISALSSGEKHDFIMFYNLIFNARIRSMVLVDEPEISLHIEWQESYLDHLIDICKMNQMQALVATHSPNIVSTHYDCLLDMGEQYDTK